MWGVDLNSNRSGIVFVSGIFNVLHPGHVRLLRFARSLGRELVVGVLSDDLAGEVATLPERQRLEAVESLKVVDRAFVIHDSVVEAIEALQPATVVKGREHRLVDNPEESALLAHGGILVFSSGDSFYNVTEADVGPASVHRGRPLELPVEFMRQHNLGRRRLAQIVQELRGIRVLVVGDVIVDEYVSCHPLGMSREDPTLVVTPIETTQ